MDNVIKLYLSEYDSIFDMVIDTVIYKDEGYFVYCYGENGELLATSEDVK